MPLKFPPKGEDIDMKFVLFFNFNKGTILFAEFVFLNQNVQQCIPFIFFFTLLI